MSNRRQSGSVRLRRTLLRRGWGLGLLLACSLGIARGSAVAQGPPPAPAPTHERVAVLADGGQQTVEGRIVVEAADGGMLLESADERYHVLQPASIVSRERIAGAVAAESPRDLGRRLIAELPAGFDVHLTKHYVICFDTTRDYAKWCGSLFERLYDTFGNFWRQAGFELEDPAQPLVVVIFSDRREYEALAIRDVGSAADRISGYYNLMSNRVASYDLTGTAGLPRARGATAGRLANEILARPEAAGLVSTLIHEATHQMAFNCGMHRRLAPIPVWVSEGIATVFEAPDLRTSSGWRGIGTVNRPRLDRFRDSFRPGDLEPLMLDDDRFRKADTSVDAYAGAWALTWFLMETRKQQFVRYLQSLSTKLPLSADSREQRLRDFTAAFGETPAEIEERLLRHMARFERRRP